MRVRKTTASDLLNIGLFLLVFFLGTAGAEASQKFPKLLVVLVIDQFRADYLTRFDKRFLPSMGKKGEVGGFQYLKSHSAYFPWGEYDLLQCITGPGHATILSGAYPYQSGIPINGWYSHEQQKEVYCTDDSKFPLVGLTLTDKEATGRSPRNFHATTVGDEFKNAGYPSRVVSIALKDRAAILLGGHRADLALWYDAKTPGWVSSQYYLPDKKLPDWIIQMNEQIKKESGKHAEWKSSGKGSGFSENSSFRHPYLTRSYESLETPEGAEMTVHAAEEAIETYHLGRNSSPDLLAVSFSSHDLAGHHYGPNSRELEEMTLAEDRMISKLLNTIRKKVPGGLENVVIVLTGDHGTAPSPSWSSQHHLEAGRISEKDLAEKISLHLDEKFGKPDQGSWVLSTASFNFFLNRAAITSKNLDSTQVEAEAKSALSQVPGVAYVLTSSEYSARKFPPGLWEQQTIHTYYPGRSGDLILIPRPFYVSGGSDVPSGFTNHHTGYSYDRMVPVLISGPNIKNGIYSTLAKVNDVAPTLSFIFGVLPPSLSEGRVLSEIFVHR